MQQKQYLPLLHGVVSLFAPSLLTHPLQFPYNQWSHFQGATPPVGVGTHALHINM